MAIKAEDVNLQTLFRVTAIADFSEKNFLVKDRFKVLELLFQTSKLNIYSGIDVQESRRVFVHVLKTQGFLKGRGELQDWVQQLRKMVAVDDKTRILQVLDMGLWRKKFVFVSEFFAGLTLFDLLLSKRELPIVFVLQVMTEISRLLVTAKKNGLKSMHINKEELFIAQNGTVKLLKFSPSRLESVLPLSGSSDISAIYSSACLLYELLTNEIPFQAVRSHAEQERAHLLAVLRVRANHSCQEIYDQIAALFLSGVTKDVDNRINVLENFAGTCEKLWTKAVTMQEGADDLESLEQLNSAFDVVAVLRGVDSPNPPERPTENEYSRVWRGMMVKKLNPDAETVFRWLAVSAIILSFVYRFFY